MTVEELAADLAYLDETSNRVPDLLSEGRIAEAEEVVRGLLAEYPDEPDGIERMAEVLEAKGESGDAAVWYRRAARYHIGHDPEHGREAAQYYLQQARRLDPSGASSADPT